MTEEEREEEEEKEEEEEEEEEKEEEEQMINCAVRSVWITVTCITSSMAPL